MLFNGGITVPAPSGPGKVVFARLTGVKPNTYFERLRALVYKGRYRTLTTDRGAVLRITPAVVGEGLLLRSSPGVDYAKPFGQVPQVRSFAIGGAGIDPEDHSTPIGVSFYEMAMRPLAPSASATSAG